MVYITCVNVGGKDKKNPNKKQTKSKIAIIKYK